MGGLPNMQIKHTLALTALLAGSAFAVSPALASDHGHDKPWVCHPVNGKGETGTGWNLIDPDHASSHIDESQYPNGHYWKHESKDGRHDEYAVNGACPGDSPEPTTTPTPTPTETPSQTPAPTSTPTEPTPTDTPTEPTPTETSTGPAPTGTPTVPTEPPTEIPSPTPTNPTAPPAGPHHHKGHRHTAQIPTQIDSGY